MDEFESALTKLDGLKADVQDPLLELNLGVSWEKNPKNMSKLIDLDFQAALISLLREFSDCFSWDSHKMLRLIRDLVEHQLPIKDRYRAIKQTPMRMSLEVILKVNEEIEL